eukprot:14986115-Ditylum_brightwellii.AAC.1
MPEMVGHDTISQKTSLCIRIKTDMVETHTSRQNKGERQIGELKRCSCDRAKCIGHPSHL